MAQIFHPSTNTISRVSIFGALFFLLGLLIVVYMIFRSPYVTGVNVVLDQPVPFSHEHHVRALGLDCRYCHTSVEKSSFAGIPPTETCMTCHSQIWTDSLMLAPVRTSMRNNTPIRWNRVHDLPDYVFFNHSIHVQKGVGCVSCHGPVDQMPMTWKAEPMTMEWCLNCHRNPELHLRERGDILKEYYTTEPLQPGPGREAPGRTDITAQHADAERRQIELGLELVKRNHIPVDRLTNCSVCHR
jgi:hypothetical protein